ncbi:MAG: hypothetical protein R3C32_11290 [Chloroflexota bacterium]
MTLALNAFALVLVGLTLLTILPYESGRMVASASGDIALSEPITATRPRPGHLSHRPRPIRLRLVHRASVRHPR